MNLDHVRLFEFRLVSCKMRTCKSLYDCSIEKIAYSSAGVITSKYFAKPFWKQGYIAKTLAKTDINSGFYIH